MVKLPDDETEEKWANFLILVEASVQVKQAKEEELADKESAKKMEKQESKVIKNEKLKMKQQLEKQESNVIKNEKLKKKQQLVFENENSIKKYGLVSWQQKKRRSVLNGYHDQRSMIERNVLVGCSKNEKKPWKMSIFGVQERKFGGWGEGCSKWAQGFNRGEKDYWGVSINQVQVFIFDGFGESGSKLFEGLNSFNASINQVQESMWKKRKYYYSGEGCSKWAKGCSSNDQKQSREKKKCSTNVVQLPSPEMSEAFKNAIRDLLNGGNEFTGEIMLVLEKNLYMTDTTQGHDRFSIPENQIKRDFLKSEEKIYLEEDKEGRNREYIEVKIIEPLLEQGTLNLRHWKSNSQYVLNGKWYDLVTRNNLKEGDFVQLWAFRIEGKLCFALNTVPSRKIPKKERKK